MKFLEKNLLKIDQFHREKKRHFSIYKTRPVSVTTETDRKKYFVLNGSTYIALLSYSIKTYITYAMFLVYLVQKLYYSTRKKCKNMLKIVNRGCHGNGGEDLMCAFLFITRQKLKTGKISGKSIFSISRP